MADTVDLNRLDEFEDSPAELRAKMARLARLVRDSRRLLVFTGAGISTSCGIPSFRGPEGVWTRKAQGRSAPSCPRLESVVPTVCHMALVGLQRAGKLDYVVSQNVDGLHLRSGLPAERVSELHGNSYLEVCWSCPHQTLHPETVKGVGRVVCADCRARVPHFCHCTGRACAGCGAPSKDSIIHFGEDLPERALAEAYRRAERSDLVLVLGSSLTVSPANDIPAEAKRRGATLVIVNLQETDMDADADLRVFARTDVVCEALMAGLGLAIPSWSAEARLSIGNSAVPAGEQDWHRWTAFVRGDAALLEDVASVTFALHPTFDPPSVTLLQPPFEVTRKGWGVFDVGVTVAFKTGREDVSLTHRLDFSPGAEQRARQVVAPGVPS